jgi:hypothetical protein
VTQPTYDPNTGLWWGDEIHSPHPSVAIFEFPDPTPEAGWPKGPIFNYDSATDPAPGPNWPMLTFGEGTVRDLLAPLQEVRSPNSRIVPDGFATPSLMPPPPSWREPIERLRVEWARWKARRG